MSASHLLPATVKVIGTNGQISLGKQFAGRQVLVEEQEPGVWLIRTATVVPDNELRLTRAAAAASGPSFAAIWDNTEDQAYNAL